MENEKYLSLERVETITGLSGAQLIEFALATDSPIFYYHSPSGMRDVPLSVLGKIKIQLNSGDSHPVKVHVLNKLTVDQLFMRDEGIRKCISFVGNQEELSISDFSLVVAAHECRPKGLLIAIECWRCNYEHLLATEGKQVTIKDRERWIKDNYPDISENFRQEIAKVANPFPLGGQKKKK